MSIRPETTTFIKELEIQSGRKLNYPLDVARLVDAARLSEMIELLEDVTFQSKFITKSYGIMKRIGVDGDGYDKLSAECELSLKKVNELLRTLLESAPSETRQRMQGTFLSLDQESLARLMGLLDDLAQVKNWLLDGKPLP